MTVTEPNLREECLDFFYREAELLDNRRLEEWLDLLTEDLTYRVPIRTTRERFAEGSEFSERGYLFKDTKSSLETRIARFQYEYAWSENPPSRTRHMVNNVRIQGIDGDEITTCNNLMVYRNQGSTTDYDLFSGEREDLLRRVDGELKLASRVVKLDTTLVDTDRLSIFF